MGIWVTLIAALLIEKLLKKVKLFFVVSMAIFSNNLMQTVPKIEIANGSINKLVFKFPLANIFILPTPNYQIRFDD
jgi:hypothetical protein